MTYGRLDLASQVLVSVLNASNRLVGSHTEGWNMPPAIYIVFPAAAAPNSYRWLGKSLPIVQVNGSGDGGSVGLAFSMVVLSGRNRKSRSMYNTDNPNRVIQNSGRRKNEYSISINRIISHSFAGLAKCCNITNTEYEKYP